MCDKEWLADYKAGKYPFVPGVQLRMRIITEVDLDDNMMPIDNTADYEVVEVLDVIEPDKMDQIMLV